MADKPQNALPKGSYRLRRRSGLLAMTLIKDLLALIASIALATTAFAFTVILSSLF